MNPNQKQDDDIRERVIELVVETILPFADGEWRKDFPDNFEWNEKNIRTLSILVGCELEDFINSEINKGKEEYARRLALEKIEEICKGTEKLIFIHKDRAQSDMAYGKGRCDVRAEIVAKAKKELSNKSNAGEEGNG